MNKLEKIPGLELKDGEPVFQEPWEAQAFALVIGMHENGVFTWQEWADCLSSVIHSDQSDTSYYKNWLMALDRLIEEKAILKKTDVSKRENEWRAALQATPHGQPIELENGRR